MRCLEPGPALLPLLPIVLVRASLLVAGLQCPLPEHPHESQPGNLAPPLAPYSRHCSSLPPLLQASPWRAPSSALPQSRSFHASLSQLPDILQGRGSLMVSSIWLSTLDPPSHPESPWHTLSPETVGLPLLVPPEKVLSGLFQSRYLVCPHHDPYKIVIFLRFKGKEKKVHVKIQFYHMLWFTSNNPAAIFSVVRDFQTVPRS